ncbi:MAG: glycosyltransferase [Methylotenera sp.]|nr:glycosyltransferase [Methylotenera sp.]
MLVYKTKVLVLLASFNGQSHIEKQLNSILNQSDVDVSILVSDDCSSDGSLDMMTSVASQHKNIAFLPSISCGGAAKNFFRLLSEADLSNADYIALSDQDDIWQNDKLSHAVKKIQENNVDAYSSNVTAFWPNGKQRLINKAQPQKQFDYMFESAGPGCTFVLTKKFALEIQAFLISNQVQCQHIALHDWFIYAFARSRGFKWLIDHESHMLYRQHAENVVGANVGIKAKIQRFKKLREGWLFEQALLIADILGYTDMVPIQKIKRLSLLDRVWLVLNMNKLRRRLRDCVALALLMLLPINITKN